MNFGYKKLFIDGKLQDSHEGLKQKVICPANGEVIGEIAEAGENDTLYALKNAKTGFKYWSSLSLKTRTDWMLKLRDAILENENELRLAIMYEMGKTYSGSKEDTEALVNSLEWYPSAMKNYRDEQIPDYDGTHHHKMIHKPAGVVVAYLAWNFPLLNIAFKLGPALASGCSIIIKPSEVSPLSAYMLGEILHDINFPRGVINILCGPTESVAQLMTRSTIPSVLTMIGSTETGKKVISESASSIKKIGMELGGNAPFIVFEDADIEKALNIGIDLKFGNCGQICVAANRFFVHENIYDNFINAYKKRVSEIKLDFGKNSKADMGPLVRKDDVKRMKLLINDAISKGGKLIFGGKIPKDKNVNGNWFEPTIISELSKEMDLFNNETFGPIAPFMKFKSDDEVLDLANQTEYGLASYIFTNNNKRIQRFSEELEFGEVQINGVKYAIYLPHGGIKNSGIGHDCSHLALEDYLVKKRVSISLT
ncbi:MAG: NAD-dependent succinate-semialdehyde dehydrogenase [Parvicellaceae bacterium]